MEHRVVQRCPPMGPFLPLMPAHHRMVYIPSLPHTQHPSVFILEMLGGVAKPGCPVEQSAALGVTDSAFLEQMRACLASLNSQDSPLCCCPLLTQVKYLLHLLFSALCFSLLLFCGSHSLQLSPFYFPNWASLPRICPPSRL